MNTTDNYQLNQWEGTDRILRTDFNADNLKTDDAVAEVRTEAAAAAAELRQQVDALTPKAGLQLIREGTLGSGGSSVDLSLTGIDWAQWNVVYIQIEPYATESRGIAIRVNGSKNYGSMSSVQANTTPPGTAGDRNRALLLFFPLGDSTNPVSGMSFGTDTPTAVTMSYSYESFSYIQLESVLSGELYSSTPYKIWGSQ